MEKFIVKKEILLDASPEKVWQALTDPEMTRKYFFGCKVVSDWKQGSPIVFKRRVLLLFPFELKGTIEKIEPAKMLSYKLYNKSDRSGFSVVTDKLTPENGKTRLTITDDVGLSEGAEKRYEKSQKGWDKILNGLKELLEHKS